MFLSGWVGCSPRRPDPVQSRRLQSGNAKGLGSGTGTAGDPNLSGAHPAAGKLGPVSLEGGIEVFDLGLQGRTRQCEEDDAGMGEALVEISSPKSHSATTCHGAK
jgi:hypothetical protein